MEKVNVKKKEYYVNNKPHILDYQKNYRTEKKEVIAYKKNLYYEANKEERLAYIKNHYELNKNTILEKRKTTKVTCDVCNCEIRKDGLIEHNSTKKHLHNLEKTEI